jgi:hypothetical protein
MSRMREFHVVAPIFKPYDRDRAAISVRGTMIACGHGGGKFDGIMRLGRPTARAIQKKATPYALNENLHLAA